MDLLMLSDAVRGEDAGADARAEGTWAVRLTTVRPRPDSVRSRNRQPAPYFNNPLFGDASSSAGWDDPHTVDGPGHRHPACNAHPLHRSQRKLRILNHSPDHPGPRVLVLGVCGAQCFDPRSIRADHSSMSAVMSAFLRRHRARTPSLNLPYVKTMTPPGYGTAMAQL
jgi:hypothetical protein